MEVKASLNNLRMSPRKVRLVVDLIKGLGVSDASAQLRFLTKRSARPIAKLLNSAVANAEHNFNLDKNNLYISKIFVNQGSTLKRWMPRAFGRATPIKKRTSHITIVLGEKSPKPFVGKKKRVSKKEETPEEGEKKKGVLLKEKEQAPDSKEESRPIKTKVAPSRPHGASTISKKRFFSRQTFGNIKKTFRRKSV